MRTLDSIPFVTVLLPINRHHEFLEEALNSISSFDYPNLEVLIIDNSNSGVKLPPLKDSFKVHKVPPDYGLSNSMNFGIRQARGKYIFVMHSDDVAQPYRITRQVEYMEKNESVDISGSGIEIIGTSQDLNVKPGDLINRTESNGKIQEFLMYKNPLFHPTVVFRADSLRMMDKLYRSKYDCVEDLELWMRASRKLIIANIPDTLVKYRIHGNQLGRVSATKSQILACVIRIKHNGWLIFHDSNLRFRAARALARNFIQLIQVAPGYLVATYRHRNQLK